MSRHFETVDETTLKIGDRIRLWADSTRVRVITSIVPYRGPPNGCVGIAYCDHSDFGFSLWPGQTVEREVNSTQ